MEIEIEKTENNKYYDSDSENSYDYDEISDDSIFEEIYIEKEKSVGVISKKHFISITQQALFDEVTNMLEGIAK